MSEINVRKGESVERALRRLKKKVDFEGTLKELRKRSYYEKPSSKRKRQKQAAKYKAKMQSEYDKWYNK